MPKPKKGARLGGSAAHQREILANLCKEIIRNKSVKTTEAKAKTVQPYMDKLITKAKKGDTHSRRIVLRTLRDREVAYILFEELAPLFEEREGGYTRVVSVGNRRGDNAPMAVISLVTEKLSPKQAVVREAEKAAERAAAKEEVEEAELEVGEPIEADAEVDADSASEDAKSE